MLKPKFQPKMLPIKLHKTCHRLVRDMQNQEMQIFFQFLLQNLSLKAFLKFYF